MCPICSLYLLYILVEELVMRFVVLFVTVFSLAGCANLLGGIDQGLNMVEENIWGAEPKTFIQEQ